MSKVRSLGVAAVFLAGCAVGGASSRFVVPPASAQQASTLTRWEYMCFKQGNIGDLEANVIGPANQFGAQGWELVTDLPVMCFKRPKM